MVKTKAIIFILIGGVLASFLFYGVKVFAGTLSCSITTAAACTGSNVVILRMSGSGNAHAELPSQSTAAYANNVVCCGGVTNLSNSCSGSYATILKLSGASNAHVQQSGSYPQSACISLPSGTAPTVAYIAGDQSCTPTYDDTLLSMSAAGNAHVGNETAYNAASNYKICATASAGLSTAISIRNVADTADVSTITFPAGDSSAVISNPTGNGDVQVLTSTASEASPVAILKSAAAYTLWYNVTSTSTWGDAVASEKLYVIPIAGNLDLTTFNASAFNMTVWGTDQEATPAQTLAADVNKELYLQVTLSALAGKTGTSMLTILGEAL